MEKKDELREYRRKLVERYQGVGEDLQKVVRRLPGERLDGKPASVARPPSQIMLHLWEAQKRGFHPRLRRILEEDEPILERESEDIWLSEDSSRMLPETALQEFLSLRGEELRWVQELPESGWSRLGRHPVWGKRTFQWWLEQSLAHAERHLQQLREALQD